MFCKTGHEVATRIKMQPTRHLRRLYKVFKHLDDNDDNELDVEELLAACPNYLRGEKGREGLHKQMDRYASARYAIRETTLGVQ